MTDWAAMRKRLEQAADEVGGVTRLAAKIGIKQPTLSVFLNGRYGKETTLSAENERKATDYLREVHNWPPMPTAQERLAKLARIARRVPPKSDRERFLEAVWQEDLAVTSISWEEIEAVGDGVKRRYRPEGGLTEDDYRFFAPEFEGHDRRSLSEAVLVNVLRARGMRTREAKGAASEIDILDIDAEEIERRGFAALADEAEARLGEGARAESN